jgi:hypothetical protein
MGYPGAGASCFCLSQREPGAEGDDDADKDMLVRIPQVKGISIPANSSMVQKPMSSGSSSRRGMMYGSAMATRLPVRPSDDRGDDRGDDRNTRADADADTDRNSDLAEREPARSETDEAACEAEDGDDLAARAFEKSVNFVRAGVKVVSAPA